jgi:hypothetical protein
MAKAIREPPDPESTQARDPLHFIVGQDRTGLWVVVETHGLYGGIFCDKESALRFAKSESADRASELELTSETLELKAGEWRVKALLGPSASRSSGEERHCTVPSLVVEKNRIFRGRSRLPKEAGHV